MKGKGQHTVKRLSIIIKQHTAVQKAFRVRQVEKYGPTLKVSKGLFRRRSK